jgi:DNA-binding transcriptional ArsR family regulator
MGSSGKLIPDVLLARVAEQFRALSEPSRLRLMSLLMDGELAVTELVRRSGLNLSNASRQLSLLNAAGWIERRKVGLQVLYSIADARVRVLCDMMCGRVQEQAARELREIASAPRRRRAGRKGGAA